jgi:hypothetical protein
MAQFLPLTSGADTAVLEEDTVKYIENKEPNRTLSRYNKIAFLLTKRDPFSSSDPVAIQESWDPPTIPVLPNDHYVQVLPEWENRPDLISLEFYGTEQLYWVIAYVNGMTDPFAETYIGRRLRIPDRENLYHDVLAK